MPSFQIRYVGPEAPEPETLIAETASEAVAKARTRLVERKASQAVIMFDGSVVQTIMMPGETAAVTEEAQQRFASAGIYLLLPR